MTSIRVGSATPRYEALRGGWASEKAPRDQLLRKQHEASAYPAAGERPQTARIRPSERPEEGGVGAALGHVGVRR